MIPTSFVYNLKKDELVKYLDEFKQDVTGTVDELRKRFSLFIGEHGAEHEDRLNTLVEIHSRSRSPSPRKPQAPDSKIPAPTTQNTGMSTSTYVVPQTTRAGGKQNENPQNISLTQLPMTYATMPNAIYTSYHPTSSQIPPNIMGSTTLITTQSYGNHIVNTANFLPTQNRCINTSYLYPQIGQPLPFINTIHETSTAPDPESAVLMDKIRKWSIKYTGSKDALAFIERVEELSAAYGVEIDKIPPLMSELLQEKALSWYRYSKKLWPSWVHFKREFLNFFLPPRYLY